jgi:hypothetical protein
MTDTYGHLHLGCIFREVFKISDNGIIYKGKKYEWKDINKISRSFGSFLFTLFMYARKYSGATVFLNDGRKIRMNARVFTKAGETPRFDVSGFVTGESRAFSEVIDFISRKTGINT